MEFRKSERTYYRPKRQIARGNGSVGSLERQRPMQRIAETTNASRHNEIISRKGNHVTRRTKNGK